MTARPLRSHHGDGCSTTVVQVGAASFGDGSYPVIAGPCSVENEQQISVAAQIVADRGASMLRGGAYKPRTSPYSFQGLGREGILLLETAGRRVGLPTVSEVLGAADVSFVAEHIDMLQVGSRNMQNFALLRELGQSSTPVLLKRGMSATIDEWILAAEYILDGGNKQVVLCERGIRTFEPATRNTLDIAAVPVLKELSHLPVIVDPSHAAGRRDLVIPLALAGRAVAADGMMVEVHPDPAAALSDGPQQLDADGFTSLMDALEIGVPRSTIDRIDHQVLRLLARRMEAAREIGRAKASRGVLVYDATREEQILKSLAAQAQRYGLDQEMVCSLYETIMQASRNAQQRDRSVRSGNLSDE